MDSDNNILRKIKPTLYFRRKYIEEHRFTEKNILNLITRQGITFEKLKEKLFIKYHEQVRALNYCLSLLKRENLIFLKKKENELVIILSR